MGTEYLVLGCCMVPEPCMGRDPGICHSSPSESDMWQALTEQLSSLPTGGWSQQLPSEGTEPPWRLVGGLDPPDSDSPFVLSPDGIMEPSAEVMPRICCDSVRSVATLSGTARPANTTTPSPSSEYLMPSAYPEQWSECACMGLVKKGYTPFPQELVCVSYFNLVFTVVSFWGPREAVIDAPCCFPRGERLVLGSMATS